MQWQKVPESNREMLDKAMAVFPGVEKKAMFGCPVYFVRGNMMAGAHQENIFVRLPEQQRQEALSLDGAFVFTPMPGRSMKEYVVLPPSIYAAEEFLDWLQKSFAWVASLPVKEKKQKKAVKNKERAGK